MTDLSRLIDVKLARTLISIVLLALAWGLGSNRRASLAAVICTIAGAVVPVLGLVVPYTGLTLSVAALLGAVWLAVRHWYGWYDLRPDARV